MRGVVPGRWGVAGVVSQVTQGRSAITSETAGGVGRDDRLPVHSTQRDDGSPRTTADLRAGVAGEREYRRDADGRAGLELDDSRKVDRRGTTKPDKFARKATDGLRRDFTPSTWPDVRSCGDFTEIPTDEGKLELAAVPDLHSWRCAGFAMGIHHDAKLARAALCVAIAIRSGLRRRRTVP